MKINLKILIGALLFLVLSVVTVVTVVRNSTSTATRAISEHEVPTYPASSRGNSTGTSSAVVAVTAARAGETKSPTKLPAKTTIPTKAVTPATPTVPTVPSGPAVFKKIVIGAVVNESEVSEDIKEHTPLAKFLANVLAGSEALGSVKISKSIVDMAELVRRGDVDLYIDTPFTAAVIKKLSEGSFIAMRAKGGVETYQSYIFVRKDSGLLALKDLVGRKMVFESPDSTTNYFLPKVVLEQAGLKLAPLTSAGEVVPGTIGYYFVGDDAIIIPDVFRKKADAGGRNSVSYIKETSSNSDQFLILAKSPKVYRSVVVASPKLSVAQVASIKEALFAMDKSEQGRLALLQSGKTLFFKAISETSSEARAMQALSSYIDEEIITSGLLPK